MSNVDRCIFVTAYEWTKQSDSLFVNENFYGQIGRNFTYTVIEIDCLRLPVSTRCLKQKELTVLADPGYYSGAEINASYQSGVKASAQKNYTSSGKAAGLYDKAGFAYEGNKENYTCPVGEVLTRRFESSDKVVKLTCYYAPQIVCGDCQLKTECTGKTPRVRRREHGDLLERMA